jgi:hypothetical protein
MRCRVCDFGQGSAHIFIDAYQRAVYWSRDCHGYLYIRLFFFAKSAMI